MGGMAQIKETFRATVQKVKDYYANLQNSIVDAMVEAKKPLLDSSNLLIQQRDFILEITNAEKMIQSEMIQAFEESQNRLAALQKR